MLTLTDEQAKQLRDALWAAADAIDTSDCAMDEDGNDEDGEPHECTKTRVLDAVQAALPLLGAALVVASPQGGAR